MSNGRHTCQMKRPRAMWTGPLTKNKEWICVFCFCASEKGRVFRWRVKYLHGAAAAAFHATLCHWDQAWPTGNSSLYSNAVDSLQPQTSIRMCPYCGARQLVTKVCFHFLFSTCYVTEQNKGQAEGCQLAVKLTQIYKSTKYSANELGPSKNQNWFLC